MPTRCPLCRQQTAQPMVCLACQKQIQLRQAKPLFEMHQTPVYAACDFPNPVKQLIYQLKFDKHYTHAHTIAEILQYYWIALSAQSAIRKAIVVPIPSHSQASHKTTYRIAKSFAYRMGYAFYPNGLIWKRSIANQHRLLNRRQRFDNVNGAMQVDQTLIKAKSTDQIIILDDILTTGSTMQEAVNTLNQAKLSNVLGLAFAHVPFEALNTINKI